MIISQNVNKNLKLDMVSQELLDYENLADCTPKEEIQSNPLKELRDQLTKTQIKVLDSLFFYKTKHKILFPSHDTIAKRSKCSRKTVIRAMKKLSALGLVSIFFRQDETCLYKISSFFFDFYRLYSLKPLLKSIKGNIIKLSLLLLPLAMLTSSYKSLDSENVPRVNNICKYINKPSLAKHYLSNVENGKVGPVGLAKKITGQEMEGKSGSSNASTTFNRSSGYMPDTKIQIIDRLQARLGLAAEDKKRLEQFEIKNLLKAEYRLATASDLHDPISYLFGMCFKIQKEGNSKNTENAYNKPKSHNSPVPKLSPEEAQSKQEQREAERVELYAKLDAKHREKREKQRVEKELKNQNANVEKKVEREKIDSVTFNKLILKAMELPAGHFRDVLLNLYSKNYEVVYEKIDDRT